MKDARSNSAKPSPLKAVRTVTVIRVGEVCPLTMTMFGLHYEVAENGASVRTSCDAAAILDAVDQAASALPK